MGPSLIRITVIYTGNNRNIAEFPPIIILFELTAPIQVAVLNSFRDVIDLQVWLCLQIGDGAGDF